jgi:hypothetical protein
MSSFVTPMKMASSSPLSRAGSVGKWSAAACATPRDEAQLLRQLSSVMQEHLDTVSRAAARCVSYDTRATER